MFTGLREQISPTILSVATLMVAFSIILLTTLELLARFETRELTLTEWDHAAHLTVAHHYLTSLSEPSLVLLRLREGIQRLNLSHGIYTTPEGGYHETITRFWICKVKFLSLPSFLTITTRYWIDFV